MSENVQAGDGNRFKGQYPIVVGNGSGETIPPYAVLQIAGATVVGSDRVFTVVKPNGSATAKYVLNGPTAISQSGFGAATDQYPAIAAHGGAPVQNTEWGPVAGSWLININGKGFTILGGNAGGLVHVAAKAGTTAGTDFPLVKIQNATGLARPYGTIFGYGVPIDPPPATLFRIPTFVSAPPTAGNPFCVSLDPVANSDVVDCGPCGVVACLLDFVDNTHTKADCLTGNFANLRSAADGPATIIWRERQSVAGGATFGVQWARVLLDRGGGSSTVEDIRAVTTTIVNAATGTIGAGNPLTPGTGSAQLYAQPTGPQGTAWQHGPTNVVWVENWMRHSIPTGKPIILRKSRDNAGVTIYTILEEDKPPATSTIRFARVYSTISAASGNLSADWGGGDIKFMDDTTGVLDVNPTAVVNPLIGVSFPTDAQVEIDAASNKVINGTCGPVGGWVVEE